ncbi:MAG: rhomboid family intramembrane serine protease [Legionellales bacterium]|nr:rhomboid family intramembrane serine protease [Legionellales bacterium]
MITFSAFSSQMGDTVNLIGQNAAKAGLIVVFVWACHILNLLTGKRLNVLGVWPRHLTGLKGVIFAPFLHADINHLFFNTIPLFLLTDFVLIATGQSFWLISTLIIVLSGLFTWITGRNAIHIGASGVIMGYWGFLVCLAVTQPTVFNVVIVVVMLYYLGGLFLNLFPSGESVSFEGHICGLVAGLLTAYIWIQSSGNIPEYLAYLWRYFFSAIARIF